MRNEAWTIEGSAESMLVELDAQMQALREEVLALRDQYWQEFKDAGLVVYRDFQIRESKYRFRVDWARVGYINAPGGGKKATFRRLPLNESKTRKVYSQSVRRMGKLDSNYMSMFIRYDKQLAEIREMVDRIGDAKEILIKLKDLATITGR